MSTSILVTVSGFSLQVFADPAPSVPPKAARALPDPRRIDPARMATDDCARARKAGKTCELTLTPEDVGGETPGPDDIALRILRFGPEGSMIRVRRDFIVEIIRSGEDL